MGTLPSQLLSLFTLTKSAVPEKNGVSFATWRQLILFIRLSSFFVLKGHTSAGGTPRQQQAFLYKPEEELNCENVPQAEERRPGVQWTPPRRLLEPNQGCQGTTCQPCINPSPEVCCHRPPSQGKSQQLWLPEH